MRLILTMLFTTLVLSCGSKKNAEEVEFQNTLDSATKAVVLVDPAIVEGILNQIPSPLEITMLLKQSGSKFNSSFLNASDNTVKYHTNFKKALNLGVYGADLGYANIYGQNAESAKHIASIKMLTDDLNLGQFFDITTIARLTSTNENLDSLLLITTQNFNDVNQYLQKEGRANLSVLLLVGGWIEAMQILCKVASEYPDNEELLERIGEQKIILGQITLLLALYKDDAQIASLAKEIEELNIIYNNVEFTHVYKESTMEVVNGVAVVKDNSTTTIKISKQTAAEITSKVNLIRTIITD